MNRTHIHFAAGLPGESGVISGMRRSCKVSATPASFFLNSPPWVGLRWRGVLVRFPVGDHCSASASRYGEHRAVALVLYDTLVFRLAFRPSFAKHDVRFFLLKF